MRVLEFAVATLVWVMAGLCTATCAYAEREIVLFYKYRGNDDGKMLDQLFNILKEKTDSIGRTAWNFPYQVQIQKHTTNDTWTPNSETPQDMFKIAANIGYLEVLDGRILEEKGKYTAESWVYFLDVPAGSTEPFTKIILPLDAADVDSLRDTHSAVMIFGLLYRAFDLKAGSSAQIDCGLAKQAGPLLSLAGEYIANAVFSDKTGAWILGQMKELGDRVQKKCGVP